MKIKTKNRSFEFVSSISQPKQIKPLKQSIVFRTLLKILSFPDMFAVNFKCNKIGMDKLGKNEPCLYLMNHSSFIDLKIASTVIYPRPFNIVCTTDGFVGKNLLMRLLGCIPTKKFVTDLSLVKNMIYAFKTLKSSVLMYPEAGYSFDGTSIPIPDSLGKSLKIFRVPVVMIKTQGAFLRDPLYNNLQLRKVNVTAEMKYILSPEDIESKTVEELNDILRNEFSFDAFKYQQDNKICVDEDFRADGLHRVLYKCPSCNTEGSMNGNGIFLTCSSCGKEYQLDEYGYISSTNGTTEFSHIPDWYNWQRECVKSEISNGSYYFESDVDIYILADMKCLYKVGDGRLKHSEDGFSLIGCEGDLEYNQKPTASYTLNVDYFWYEIGDVICLGNSKMLYYCFPKDHSVSVTKARFAAEELYKLS
ncbi:MAG: hypothetical protein E7477_03910 [Ruminococcaceae bacterium]|nr:hypothetical protein [Oscillospiraceae bacterium]